MRNFFGILQTDDGKTDTIDNEKLKSIDYSMQYISKTDPTDYEKLTLSKEELDTIKSKSETEGAL